LSLDEIQDRLRHVDYDRAALHQALEHKRQQTRKSVAQEVRDLIQSKGHDVTDILSLITIKKRASGQPRSYIHYVDPENPEREYVRGVLPAWMKEQMRANGFDPAVKEDRQLFKEQHLQQKIEMD